MVQAVQFVLFIETYGISKIIPTSQVSEFLHILGVKIEQERYTFIGYRIYLFHQLFPTGQLKFATGTAYRIDIRDQLLNTVLTVVEHRANSHKGKGWEEFTDGVIKKISEGREGVVFLLWGANARSKKAIIDSGKHLVLETVHPSPLSAYNGFFGCNHFIKANEYLTRKGKTPIDWSNL